MTTKYKLDRETLELLTNASQMLSYFGSTYKMIPITKLKAFDKDQIIGQDMEFTSWLNDLAEIGNKLLEAAPADKPMSKSVMKRINVQEGRNVLEAAQDSELCKYGNVQNTCHKDPMNCQCLIDSTLEAQDSEPVGEVHLQENGLLNCLLWGKAIDDGLVKDGDFIYTHPPADKDAVTSKSILKLLKGLESKTTYKGKDLTLTMFSDGSGRIDDVDGIEIHSFNNLIILKAIIDEAMKG